jgi:hypothetical protein
MENQLAARAGRSVHMGTTFISKKLDEILASCLNHFIFILALVKFMNNFFTSKVVF